MSTKTLSSIGMRLSAASLLLLLLGHAARAGDDDSTDLGADNNFSAWHLPTGDWYEAGDATLDSSDNRQLVGKPGTGVLINGKTGRTNSLVTKQTFQDVQVHLEFMVAKGSNSGVIFHGNHEIQILDSYGVKQPTAGDCGGVYPRAEGQPGTPSYHHLDGGSAPSVNAAKPPGEWQTMDIVFKAARFDGDGKKTSHAKVVKVVHNGQVIQENVEVPWACGPDWDRKQFPRGSVILQGDYGPVAFRNVRVRPWQEETAAAGSGTLNVPPPGFTALFNGRDFTGWRMSPKAREYWSIEDGVLKSPGLLEEWGADLVTEKAYRDFVLLLDFRMPAISDSGINFRRLIPAIPGFGDQEQFNLRSKFAMGELESYYFLPNGIARRVRLKEEEEPKVRHIDPEVGAWHTVKLTMQGRSFSAEYDGEVLYDRFKFHDWMMNLEPAPIRLQKHIVVNDENLGQMNPCPIEYRNIFIKDLGPSDASTSTPSPSSGESRGEGRQTSRPMDSPNATLLARIDKTELPSEYDPAKHQDYVDRHWPKLSPEQVARALQLWEEKQKIDPEMPNRAFSFVKIMTYVAQGEKPPAVTNKQSDPSTNERDKSQGKTPETRSSRSVNAWKWSAATDTSDGSRKAMPVEIPAGPTIHVAGFGLLEDDNPPVVLLPESRLAVTGRLATAQPAYFGITVHHPNGDFAGRFLVIRPAEEFQSGKDFHVTLDFHDFQLDSTLAGMKDKLPNAPFHFVVESIWVTTLDKKAGLEIAEVELSPPSKASSSERVPK